jgi:hypothetical protein
MDTKPQRTDHFGVPVVDMKVVLKMELRKIWFGIVD